MKEDIIGKFFKQNCGDIVLVKEKINERNKNKDILYRCEFQKYKCEIRASKNQILRGTILNPQIEQVEFIDKIWPQNCGDSLKIIEKSNIKKNSTYLWKCEFVKYPYQILALKQCITKGSIINPRIEEEEFIKKVWPQNCGDSLKIIEKQQNSKNWICQFINYPYEVLASKEHIISGQVFNYEIDNSNFIGKEFLQNCGDILIVKEKIQDKFKVEFIKYPYITISSKNHIKNRCVDNPNLPWKSKGSLIKFIQENFKEKPTQLELSKKLGISFTGLNHKILEFELKDYINYFESNQEKELRNYVLQLDKNFVTYNDKNYEIDIYSPSLKFGFEFNGNYWHSNLYKENNYHQEKSLYFQNRGVNLIHIFEYEWLNKQEIIKSLIKLRLGIFNKKIGASKCKIKELDYRTYANFCNKNHLQGECGAKVKLGLFYKDELVQIMSFGSPRFTLDYEYEIIRECSKLGYIIIGGKEKLWSYFLKNYFPKNCISYCDFSKFTGDSYLKLGFKKERLNKPGFVWYDEKTKEVFWRDPFHHKEMKEKGYLKIYDCGQLVFVWNKL